MDVNSNRDAGNSRDCRDGNNSKNINNRKSKEAAEKTGP